MYDDKDKKVFDLANSQTTGFPVFQPVVNARYCARVIEDLFGKLEINLVFGKVRRTFCFVPFEFHKFIVYT